LEKMKASFLALVRNKWFCLFCLVFGCAYATIFGMLYVEDMYTEGLRSVNIFGVLIEPTMRATASVIGKTYVWSFRFWGAVQSIALAPNILYAYRRYNYKSRAGSACVIAAVCCILINNYIPSTENFGLQLVVHWGTALLFAVLSSASFAILMLRFAKTNKKFLVTFIVFAGMLAAMIGLLIVFGKSGAIESIPLWGFYLTLLLVNYTGLYKESLPMENTAANQKEVRI